MTDTTNAAIMALARFQRTSHGMALFRDNFYDGRTVVACHSDDLISVVLERVMHTNPPVTLAVHFPSRSGAEEFIVMDLSPENVDSLSAGPGMDAPSVGVSSTVGMLADSLHPGRQSVKFTWANFSVSPFALAHA